MKIGFVMEPIPAKNLKKDSTLLLMFEAQNNGHDIYFIDSKNLFMKGNQPFCKYQKVEVSLNDTNFNVLSSSENIMNFFDVIIIGGGLSGSSTAVHLSNKGYSVLVLEKSSHKRIIPCAGGMAATMRNFLPCLLYTSPSPRD